MRRRRNVSNIKKPQQTLYGKILEMRNRHAHLHMPTMGEEPRPARRGPGKKKMKGRGKSKTNRLHTKKFSKLNF
jgi:hypothetical protein